MDNSPVFEADIGDGVSRRFFLGYDELIQIKRECGRGFYSLYTRFLEDAEPEEVAAVVRLALIGGGEDPKEALALTNYYCKPPRALKPAFVLAYQCLEKCWLGSSVKSEKKTTVSEKEMDEYFTDLEASIIRAGQDPSWMKGRSFAEIQDLLSSASRKAPGAGPAPDAETFNAIKKSASRMN